MKKLAGYLFLPVFIALTVLCFWHIDISSKHIVLEIVFTALVLITWGLVGFLGFIYLTLPLIEKND